MSGGGSKAPTQTSTTTVQKADPWSGQQPYLTDIFKQAQAQYQAPGPYYYPHDTIANFDPRESQAQDWLTQYATGGAAQSANQALQTNSALMDPSMMDVSNNPYVQGMNQASVRDYLQAAGQNLGDISQTLTRQWLPQVDSGAVASGQYGGSRQGLAQGTAIGDATRSYRDFVQSGLADLGNMLAQTNLGAYNTGVSARQQAALMNPSLVQAGAVPMQMLAGVGTQQREMNQALIDDAQARWNYQQGLPAQKLSDYSSMVQGQYGGASSSQTTGEMAGQGTSTGANVMGAAMTGLGTYGMLSGSAGAAMGLTAAAPWLAGAVALGSLLIK